MVMMHSINQNQLFIKSVQYEASLETRDRPTHLISEFNALQHYKTCVKRDVEEDV